MSTKMNTPEYRLKKMFEYKLDIQKLEHTQEENKKTYRELGAIVKSNAQKIGEMKKTLFEMI